MKSFEFKNQKREFICRIVLALSDLFWLNVALGLSFLSVATFLGSLNTFMPLVQIDVRIFSHFIMTMLCVFWFGIRLRHYAQKKPFWSELKETLRTIVIFSIFDLALVAFSKWHFSRYIWVYCWFYAIILVPLSREIVKHLLDKLGYWKKSTVILGVGRNAREAYYALQSEEVSGFKIDAFCDFDTDIHTLEECPVIRNEETLLNTFNPFSTQFVVACDYNESDKFETWLRFLAKHKCRNITIIPSLRGFPLYGTSMSFIFSHEVLLLQVHNNLSKATSRFIKRFFDIVCTLGILAISSPLFIYLWYTVSRDGGPAIYAHTRIGRRGKEFNCYKFRSMVMNSQEVLDDLLTKDPLARSEWEKDFKLKDDPRITRIGRFIRKTSLDELPQLFNVLKGEMSLVGPRPVIQEELERYSDDVEYYLMVKPGMTGLWQVSGRNDVDYATRVYFDSWYVKNWSLWNDIVILFKTINVVLLRKGAY
ncbi:undecaprenyl-phosphate galactose phosphotransferase WbaP [Kosakonia radicincitans]|uniref:Undecaprenyl-phosphate galactose phosphotransferase n=1 Tax=Kosakonia radicincitans TaxID=283686 RepID=A0AAX2EV94_9ENTR|nr:undecaprenyl-phosphate galactose phosphotransferase WbaP [Kosakonia radicincitans]MDP9567979.1 undecaprenyl-phosphate galactose phosphotransferase [Kosakonia oryzae]QEM90885.1 undecaprenyl-phosphate galactose phosphotransferase WbaP [Kosakonia radicincitans]SFF08733.1 undecaprenyl-phosphate galactose phosphotransferase [Kosakonia radicincitans]SFR20594.1 undecaprenyl-phosphate galactose phosphotransferase [Kosakonia radicincitans]SFT90424.1 undecaprenyl-phosphate galactose phosphotransferas